MRMSFSFDTEAPAYAWLNRRLFIAHGRLAGSKQIEYAIHRVT